MTTADPEAGADWDQRVAAALVDVVDPCSLAAGAPLSLVDMGLVRGSAYDAATGTLVVRLSVTGPGCTFFGAYSEAARSAVGRLPGVRHAEVVLDTETVWHPGHLTEAGARSLADRRERTLQLSQVRPRMWQEQP